MIQMTFGKSVVYDENIVAEKAGLSLVGMMLHRMDTTIHGIFGHEVFHLGDQLCGNRFFHKPVTGFFTFTGSQIPAYLLINVLHGEPDMVIYKK